MKLACGSSLLAFIAFLSLMGTVSTLATISYAYNNTATSPFKLAAYPFGILSNGTTVNVLVSLWNTPATLVGTTLVLKDERTMTAIFTKTCTIASICELTYYITITQRYYVQVTPPTPSLTQVSPFYLVAKSFPGNSTYPGNPNEQLLLKLTDILRSSYLGKYLYIGSETNITVSIYPLATERPVANVFYLLPINANYQISMLTRVPTVKVSYTNQILTATARLTKGFYVFGGPATGITTDILVPSWQTDPYACPYDPSYVDYYSFFAPGCNQPKSQVGFPCLDFNTVTQSCSLCINGYFLDSSSGSCKANTTCPDRKYYHFGQCFDVNVNCGKFDPFTGSCLTCADPNNYDLVDGSCVHKSINCTDRQWQTNYTCYDVSDKCATFDASTGFCLTCKDQLFQVASNGSCIPIVITCPQGQYAVGLACVTIPIECADFDRVRGICLRCVQGYYAENGVCKRIICPDGQAPSRFGLFCIDVSILCSTYDPLNGNCISCKLSNHRVTPEGKCIQYTSPLAGCSERQRLGFGKCENPENNCKAYNLITSDCDECEQGFYLDFTGHCVKSPDCSISQWSVNGECIGIPENCLAIN